MAVITISRQYGSEGDEIAAHVCEQLGYRAFDRRLIEQVASEVGLTASEIVDFSEDEHKMRGFLDRLLRGRVPVSEARVWKEDGTGVRRVDVTRLDETASIALVQSVVKAAHRQGNVVIVGRGGQTILKGEADVLQVRIVAPLDLRTRRVQLHEGLSFEQAGKVIAQRDAAATDYVKRFYGVDSSDPTLYHLVINTGRWNIESAAQLIVEAVNCLTPMAVPG
jgi:cytidylate kinase